MVAELDWSEILNVGIGTTAGGVIASLVGGLTAYWVDCSRRAAERADKATAVGEERIATGQSALILLALQIRTVGDILDAINPYRGDPRRWRTMPNVQTPLVVTSGHLSIAPLMFLSTGANATKENAILVNALGRTQHLLDGAIETATGRRQAYAHFHDEVAANHPGPAPIQVPDGYFDGPMPVRLANAVSGLRRVTDGLYSNTDLAYQRLRTAIFDLHARLKVEFPDQKFPHPENLPEDPAAFTLDSGRAPSEDA